MTERWRCAHGLTLSEHCDACEVENARELVRHWGAPVDEARKLIEQEKERANESAIQS
jgi:hypothetical protein